MVSPGETPGTSGQAKTEVSMWLDHDVVKWFKSRGRGYQTRINAVLRAYVESHPP